MHASMSFTPSHYKHIIVISRDYHGSKRIIGDDDGRTIYNACIIKHVHILTSYELSYLFNKYRNCKSVKQ